MSSTPTPKLPSAELSLPGGSSRPPARRVDPPSAWPAAAAVERDLSGVVSGVGRKQISFEGAGVTAPPSNLRRRDGRTVARFGSQEWSAARGEERPPAQPSSGEQRNSSEQHPVCSESERQRAWDAKRGSGRSLTAADALPVSRRSFQHTSMELRAPVGLRGQEAVEAPRSQTQQPLPEYVVRYGTEPSPGPDTAAPISPDRVATYGVYRAAELGEQGVPEGGLAARGVTPGVPSQTLPGTKAFDAPGGEGYGGHGGGHGAATATGSGGYGAEVGRASGGVGAVTAYGAEVGRASGGVGAVTAYGVEVGRASGGYAAEVAYGAQGRASGGFGSVAGAYGAVPGRYGSPVSGAPAGIGAHASGAHRAVTVGGAAAAAAPFDGRAAGGGGALGARPSYEMQGVGGLGLVPASARLSGSFEAPMRPSGASLGVAGAAERLSLELSTSGIPQSGRSSASSHLPQQYPSGVSPHAAVVRGSGITRWQLAAMAASFAFSLLLVLLAIERPQVSEASDSAAGAVAGVLPNAAAAPGRCVIRQVPERLALAVERRVPLEVMVRGKQLSLGFAEARGTAIGMIWSPGEGRPRVAYREHPRAAVQGVAPVLSSLHDDFHVDTTEAEEVLRTFGGQERLQLVSKPGNLYVRRSDGQSEHRLWSFLGNLGGTRPRVLQLGPKRYAVAMREGDQAGRVLVGTFHADGDEPAHSVAIPFGSPSLGSPALAAHEGRLALAVTSHREGRASGMLLALLQDGPDGVTLLHEAQLTPPTGAHWSDPHLAASGDDAWLLQWTEQREGGQEVRVRVLDSELQPAGPELLVSPRGASAMAASVVGNRLPSAFYLLASGSEYELWVQALHCD